jgi:hypothetical protein
MRATAGGKKEADQYTDGGGLAGSVGPDEAENLPLPHFQVQSFDATVAPVELGQLGCFNNVHLANSGLTLWSNQESPGLRVMRGRRHDRIIARIGIEAMKECKRRESGKNQEIRPLTIHLLVSFSLENMKDGEN